MTNTSMCVQKYRFIATAEIGFHEIKLKNRSKILYNGTCLKRLSMSNNFVRHEHISGC